MAELKRIGVVGCGLMGSGIAQVCLSHGYEVVSREVDQATLDRGLTGLRGRLSREVERGRPLSPVRPRSRVA